MSAEQIPLPRGQVSLLKALARRLWRNAGARPPTARGLVASQQQMLEAMRFLPPLERQSPPFARLSYRMMAAMFGADRVDLASVHEESIGIDQRSAIRARIYIPYSCLNRNENPGLVYFHGGGCVIGDLETHDDLCRIAAARNNCIVISVHYRLAPQHRFPRPLLDALHAWNWVCRESRRLGLDPARTGVGGDSAGGLLATTVCQQSRNPTLGVEMARMPAYQWLVYPWLDCRLCSDSSQRCVDGMILTRSTMVYFIELYLGDGTSPDDPLASPLLCADLDGLPETYIATAGFDPLEDEGRDYAQRLLAAGVAVTRDHFPDVMHGFVGMCGVCPASARHVETMLGGLRQLQEHSSER